MKRTVLITGAARGIGRAVAKSFATSGDVVMLHYSNSRSAPEGAVDDLTGTGHQIVSGDLRDPQETERIVSATVERLGRVDVLV